MLYLIVAGFFFLALMVSSFFFSPSHKALSKRAKLVSVLMMAFVGFIWPVTTCFLFYRLFKDVHGKKDKVVVIPFNKDVARESREEEQVR